jgi:hypothetical protein
VYYKFVKFHKNSISGLGGVVLTRYMDGWTYRVIPIYPPNFVCRGIIKTLNFTKSCMHLPLPVIRKWKNIIYWYSFTYYFMKRLK